MARYHLSVSLTKEAFLNPHALDDGLEIVEQADRGPSIGSQTGSPNSYPADDLEDGR